MERPNRPPDSAWLRIGPHDPKYAYASSTKVSWYGHTLRLRNEWPMIVAEIDDGDAIRLAHDESYAWYPWTGEIVPAPEDGTFSTETWNQGYPPTKTTLMILD
jgi:hypothetical protein